MWTRKELKEKAKRSVTANYWKTVLVSLILAFVVGTASGGAAGAGPGAGSNSSDQAHYETDYASQYAAQTEADESVAGMLKGETPSSSITRITEFFQDERVTPGMAIGFGILLAVIILLAVAFILAAQILILNPVEVGCKRFMVRNLNQKANVGELGYAFDVNYKTNVKTMFFMKLYTFLWTLLFIIPGIVKKYEYRMIPYILAAHPEMSDKEAFAKSKEMMRGNKWSAFVLDLSFIGWEILSLFTFGMVHTFYVGPYRDMTNAALYEKLEYGQLEIEEA